MTARTTLSRGSEAGPAPADPEQAWQPYQPGDGRPWNLALAAHLLRRAGFGASHARLQQAFAAGPQRTIDVLLRPEADAAAFDRAFDEHEAAAADAGGEHALRGWWLRRMLETPHPLQEKTTLFWLGHVAADGSRAGSARLLQEHVRLLRSQALGDTRILLASLLRDPATLLGHGAEQSHRSRPNERLARHLLENVTLGPGAFSQEDVQEAARALTGGFVRDGRYAFVAREHDAGVKRILGRQGSFAGDDLIDVLLEQPATAERLAQKLCRWLIADEDEPERALIAPLAAAFAHEHDFGKLVETVLRSNLFFSARAYRRKVKSPIEYALGLVIALEGVVSTTELAKDLAALGQELFRPPAAKGWAGGRRWIDEATLARRHNLAADLLRGAGRYGDRLDPHQVARRHGCEREDSAARFLVDLLLQGDRDLDAGALLQAVHGTSGGPAAAARALARALARFPEYQLA
ncbi:MAG: DUF1800 family protein [Planctomycetes bacterium]|nr:DUF1800 family protein [Planctomycetota bacterium]